MWKINNNSNKIILKKYNLFIEDFFQTMIELAKKKNKLSVNSDLIEKHFDKKRKLSSKLLKIDKYIKPLIIEIIKLGEVTLKREYKIFKYQNEEIRKKRNYNLTLQKHPDSLKKLFKDYFYSKFFSEKWIWTQLIKHSYSREIFKTNFKKDNGLIICPYCDIDTITIHTNSDIEHFLPKAKFPYVCCNYYNLMPSCSGCNLAETGKGQNVKIPITNQYKEQIGDKLAFNLDINGKINIDIQDSEAIENFLALLQLREKYTKATDDIIDSLKISLKRMEYFKQEINADNYTNYLEEGAKKERFYFVQKDIFKYIDDFI